MANAIFDGADAVMLSAETCVGDYAVETVQTMAKIICAVEDEVLAKGLPQAISKPRTKGGAVARAAAELGDYLSASYLVAFTQSGDTARGWPATARRSRCWPSPRSRSSAPSWR